MNGYPKHNKLNEIITMTFKAMKQLPNKDPLKQAFFTKTLVGEIIDVKYSNTSLKEEDWNKALDKAMNNDSIRAVLMKDANLDEQIVFLYTAKGSSEVLKKSLDLLFAKGKLSTLLAGYAKTDLYNCISITAVGDTSLVPIIRMAVEKDTLSTLNDKIQGNLFTIGNFKLQDMHKEYLFWGNKTLSLKQNEIKTVKVFTNDDREIQDHMYLMWYSENEDIAKAYKGRIIPGKKTGSTIIHVFEYGSPYEQTFKVKVKK